MRQRTVVKFVALTLAVTAMLPWSGAAMAGQFKNIHTTIPGGGCVSAHSSPENVNSAMAMEVFEFVTPAVASYRCCISNNTTGQDLFVRLIGLTGAQLALFQTPVNGTGCTASIGLGSPFAFQCTVASGAGSPVGAGAHYVLDVCRQ